MKRKIHSFLLEIIVFFIPFVCLFAIPFLSPSVYHNTFLAELSDKYDRLNSVEGKKIVVIGGSNIAFGLDSKQLEEAIGIPTVNFGLYASLGSKVMLDLSKDAIKPGDIVILAFEPDNQTLSMYFNSDSMWQAVDCDYNLLRGLSADDYGKMSGGFYKYIKDKIGFLINGAPNPSGIYNKESFNEYSDISYIRDSNIMPAGFDANQLISFEDIVLDADFVDYVNTYIDFVEEKGAEVCFSYCPINSLAIKDDSYESKKLFVSTMSDSFNAPNISNIDDYIFDSQYFYDTNFHLNDRGSVLRTRQLAKDIAAFYGLEYKEIEIPDEVIELSSGETNTIVDDSSMEFEDCFIYEEFYDVGWAICGVTEKGKNSRELGIPAYHDGSKVLAILTGAFEECNALESINIVCGENDSLTLYDGAFAGVETLKSVNLYASPDSIKVGTEGLIDGASKNLHFYVEKKNFASYVTNYYWSIYAEKTKVIK